MTIRFYFDEDSQARSILQPLRARGIDVETAADSGMLGRDDEDQLTYATSQGRVMVTANAAHFALLHRHYLGAGQTHAGIVIIHQQRYSVGELIRRLLRLASTRTSDDMCNHLEFLSSGTLAEPQVP